MDANENSAIGVEVAAFVRRIDELYGPYLDATLGFKANAHEVIRGQGHSSTVIEKGTDPDSLPMFIGRGAPGTPQSVLLHQTTQGDFKRRNEEGGENHIRVAHWLIVLLFEYWESEHRARIAKALGTLAERLKAPIFGDLRRLRHVVIHRRGVVDEESLSKLEVLGGFKAGRPLTLSADDMELIVRALKGVLDQLVQNAVGSDPEHRKAWRV